MKKTFAPIVFCLTAFVSQGLDFSVTGNARAEKLAEDKVLVEYLPGKGWPQIRFFPQLEEWGHGEVSFSLQQIEPQKRIPYGITVGTWNPRGALQASYIESELKPNETVKFSFKQIGQKTPESIFIAAKNPTEKAVIAIKGIQVDKNNLTQQKKKKRLPPIPAIKFKGKAFFPLGAYDTAPVGGKMLRTIDPGFLAAGGNFADFGNLCMPWKYYDSHSQPAIFAALEEIKNNKDFDNVALLVGLGWNLLMDDAETPEGKWGMNTYVTPAIGESLQKRQKTLAEATKKLSEYPNIIGYTMDEPENLVWQYYKANHGKEWERDKDKSLAGKMVEWIGWTNDIIRENHPEAQRMPIIAWWTTYADTAELYDVLIANTYVKTEKEEFDGAFYSVSYDAAMQVNAVRQIGGGRSAIFMPQMYDRLGDARGLTLKEQRYVNFAPITRGVMGVHGWRLMRCTAEHRQNVIFPAMKEVSQLSDFFLGEWFDELVYSDHDTASVDYLKKFNIRIRLVEGQEDDETVTVKDAVPDVSYCLRKHQDGRYLLLAVNNRKEELTVNFRVELKNLPDEIKDGLNGTVVKVDAQKGTFQDHFAPFEVRAYVFSLRE